MFVCKLGKYSLLFILLLGLNSFAAAQSARGEDCNGNEIPDSLELDSDQDAVIDACDNCTFVPNPRQTDVDRDGIGNLCDPDVNNDGRVNFEDLEQFRRGFFGNDPLLDLNGDGIVNFVELNIVRAFFFGPPGPGLPGDRPDRDGDGVPDDVDNCIDVFNPLQVDLDLDGFGDLCDNCITQPNPDQADANGDGEGDACAPDPLFAHCELPFVPDRGVDEALFDPELPDPRLPGVVHPVIQLSSSLHPGHRELLRKFGVELQLSLSRNLFLGAVQQNLLEEVAAIPFVRALFPLPEQCRMGRFAECPGLQFGAWRRGPVDPAPLPREEAGFAYQSREGFSLLFGGYSRDFGILGDTQIYDGNSWLELAPLVAPDKRRDHAMANDESNNVVLLFGGLFSEPGAPAIVAPDTWVWDGDQWIDLSGAADPRPRHGHGLSEDRERKQIVLFGGQDEDGNLLGDTWVWRDGDWRELSPADAPSPRAQFGMAYDAARDEVVLYGGRSEAGIMDDTWAFDGENWHRRDDAGAPGKRVTVTMSADDAACGVIIFGGLSGDGQLLDDAWFWNGDEWSRVEKAAAVRPGPRHNAAMAYDLVRDIVMVVGGSFDFEPMPWELEPSYIMEVQFHPDVPFFVANNALLDAGAIVLQPGTDVDGRRVNFWHAAVPRSRQDQITGRDSVVAAQFTPPYELHMDGVRAAANANAVQAGPYCGGAGCSGNGIVLAEWDGGWVSGDVSGLPPPPPLPAGGTHIALAPRTMVRDLPALDPADGPLPPGCGAGSITCNTCQYSDHATHVAGIMLGNGAGAPGFVGMSPQANHVSYNWFVSVAELQCEMTDSILNFGARAANNSWGFGSNCGTQALYDMFSQGLDNQIRANPVEAIQFSSANAQRLRNSGPACAMPPIYTPAACTAPPPGVAPPPVIPVPAALVSNRFYTLSPGIGSNAKNTLVVGAVNSGAPIAPPGLGRMTTFSSWGPTRDGRIKPDLVAAGAENNLRDSGFDPGDPLVNAPVCTTTPPGPPPGGDVCSSIGGAYAGKRGTSMSTPAVTGAIGLAYQHQASVGLVPGDTQLDSDSVKALLIHTATDLQAHFPVGGNFMALQNCGGTGQDCWPVPAIAPGAIQDGPDFANGWGMLNAQAALDKITAGNAPVLIQPSGCPAGANYPAGLPFNSPLALGGDPTSIGIAGCSTTSIWDWVGYTNVPVGTTQLKVTIAWNDAGSPPPAAASTAPVLVNDLDLIVTRGNGQGGAFSPLGPHNYSWWTDPACPHRQAVPVAVGSFNPAVYADQRNNVEQVIINNPMPGQHRIVVQGVGLATPTQPFAIMISMPPTVP